MIKGNVLTRMRRIQKLQNEAMESQKLLFEKCKDVILNEKELFIKFHPKRKDLIGKMCDKIIEGIKFDVFKEK